MKAVISKSVPAQHFLDGACACQLRELRVCKVPALADFRLPDVVALPDPYTAGGEQVVGEFVVDVFERFLAAVGEVGDGWWGGVFLEEGEDVPCAFELSLDFEGDEAEEGAGRVHSCGWWFGL